MKKRQTHALVFMALCIVLNIVIGNLVLMLKLPVYLDSVGTILAASLLGPLPGMLVGGSTGVIIGVTSDIFSLFFMPVQLITAAVTGLLFRKSVLANPASCWWQALIISLPGTIVSTVITISIFHGITSSGSSLIVQLLTGIGMNQAFAVFIVQVATDYLDRLLSILLVSLTLRIGGKRLSSLWQ
ncbi:MAG TPA: ECF transporter S component [Tetragenococcus sp.]|nr:ECF transporter S component [Tetragenococcus sp.]